MTVTDLSDSYVGLVEALKIDKELQKHEKTLGFMVDMDVHNEKAWIYVKHSDGHRAVITYQNCD